MRPKDRQLQITDLIRKEGRVTVDKLANEFNSSPETIRRDLNVLATSGKIQKIHGGAILNGTHVEGPFLERMGENLSAKRHIAKKACELIFPGDTLLIGTGTTTLAFSEELTQIKNLTVITNSLDIAKVIGASDNEANVFLLGGEYSSANRENLGAMVISQLKNFQVQHHIMPVGYIDAVAGITDFEAREVEITSAMLAHAPNNILLSDSSKFNRVAPFVVGQLDQFDTLVCEKEPELPLKEALVKNNIEVIY